MKILLIAALLAAAASAHAETITEQVSFPGARSEAFPAVETVRATLSRPAGGGKTPAVVILHGSGGIDGRGAFHAEELNRQGLATLEVFMFNRGGRPKEGHATTLTHAFGALKFLASHPNVEAGAIGVMGFSWGGNVTLRAASKPTRDAFAADLADLRFAAHAAFYPVCWSHTKLAGDPGGAYSAFTGAPVLVLAGGEDDYGAPDDCVKLVEQLNVPSNGTVSLQFYPTGTHGWDTPAGLGRSLYDPVAFQGKGGTVRFTPDREIAAESRARAAEFFAKYLRER